MSVGGYELGDALMSGNNPAAAALGGVLKGAASGALGFGSLGKLEQISRLNKLTELIDKKADWGIPFRKASGNPDKAIDTLLQNKQGFVPNAINKLSDADIGHQTSNINYSGEQHIPSPDVTGNILNEVNQNFNPLNQNTTLYGYVSAFTPEQIGAMSGEEFAKNEAEIFRQAKQGMIKPQNPSSKIKGFKNPLTGSSQIFTQEDIGSMSAEEYAQNEDAIMAQVKEIGVPTNAQMEETTRTGGAVYVRPYTRSDGTQVKGYYRSN